jgi:hypothetical protein
MVERRKNNGGGSIEISIGGADPTWGPPSRPDVDRYCRYMDIDSGPAPLHSIYSPLCDCQLGPPVSLQRPVLGANARFPVSRRGDWKTLLNAAPSAAASAGVDNSSWYCSSHFSAPPPGGVNPDRSSVDAGPSWFVAQRSWLVVRAA